MRSNYDLIIVGCGASGQSVLHYLRELNHNLSILLIEPSPQLLKEKTWCFWHTADLPYPQLLYKQWDKFRVILPDRSYSFDILPFRYSCIRGTDFHDYMWQAVNNDYNVTVLNERVASITSDNQRAVVKTESDTFEAPLVLQSAFKPTKLSKPNYPVWQHFLGWEIQTESQSFDSHEPIFMDFDPELEKELGFTYLLPWSQNQALIEYTVFSDQLWKSDAYEKRIRYYLKEKYGLLTNDYAIHRIEQGKIPMMDRFFPSWYDEHHRIYNLGANAGLTKASTGYTFANIQHQAQAVADAIVYEQSLPIQFGSPKRFRAYDMLLLDIIHRQPEKALDVFSALFQKNPIDRILRFLDERSQLSEELAIMGNMPYLPFFKAIGHNFSRLVKGEY